MNENRYQFTKNGLIDTHTGEVINTAEIVAAKVDGIKRDVSSVLSTATGLGVPLGLKVVKTKNQSHQCVPIKEGYKYNRIYEVDLQRLFEEIDLNFYSLAFIARFTPYISFPQNSIIINSAPPTIKQIGEILKTGKTKTEGILKELEFYEIIKRVREGRTNLIYFNPFLFCSGKLTDIETYRLFEQSRFNPSNK